VRAAVPPGSAATGDRFLFPSQTGAEALPENFEDHGNYVISLANVTRWLGQRGEALGAEILSRFPLAELHDNEDGSVKCVATGDVGIGKNGESAENFKVGMELLARYTLLWEGARGHFEKQFFDRFKVRENADLQV
jgi:electron-transferring-flavoprotein dehydrogenase